MCMRLFVTACHAVREAASGGNLEVLLLLLNGFLSGPCALRAYGRD